MRLLADSHSGRCRCGCPIRVIRAIRGRLLPLPLPSQLSALVRVRPRPICCCRCSCRRSSAADGFRMRRFTASSLLAGSIDRRREIEILLGNASRIVRAERERHLRVADVDIRMMVRSLRLGGHPIEQQDDLGEGSHRKGFLERVAAPGPARQRSECTLNLEIGEGCSHGVGDRGRESVGAQL